jgi:signal transduction histidine kinase
VVSLFHSTRAQLIVLLLGSLLAAQCFSIAVFAYDRDTILLRVRARDVVERLLHVTEMIDGGPQDVRNAIVALSNSRDFRIVIAGRPLTHLGVFKDRPDMADMLREDLEISPQRQLFVSVARNENLPAVGADLDNLWDDDAYKAVASTNLMDGTWLTAYSVIDKSKALFAWQAFISLLVTVVIVVVVVGWLIDRITRPLHRLSQAAEKLGRGEDLKPIPIQGPTELTTVTIAFNEMAGRITRLLQERSRTLAAIGHDLRSPLTAMQLRIEMIEDNEVRERMAKCLDEISGLVQAALALSRASDTTEPTEIVSLHELLFELVDELREAGGDAHLVRAASARLSGRRLALKRALRNIAENAIRYGSRARIALTESEGEITISIEDDGPGIPEAERARVFDPFVRLESSRNRQTGGFGLGLAIAKSIVDSHAGTIVFEAAEPVGARAVIRLPVARSSRTSHPTKLIGIPG